VWWQIEDTMLETLAGLNISHFMSVVDVASLIVDAAKSKIVRADPMAALKEELAGMKTGALNKRAREVGVGADAMDDAADEDDPRTALIALIVASVQTVRWSICDLINKISSVQLTTDGLLFVT
jgi:hypothetical protein